MTVRRRAPGFALLLAVLSVLASRLAVAAPSQQSDTQTPRAIPGLDRRGGFGRAESITGTISLARPDTGLLILTQRGPGQPPSLVIKGATIVTRNPDGTTTRTDTGVTAEPGPGETDYHFRLTNSTLIRVNGRSATPSDLAGLQDKEATVHFVPQRSGNFAQTVEVNSSPNGPVSRSEAH